MSALDSVNIKKITLSGGGKTYDVANFSCQWSLNAVPRAQCRIITGQGVIGASGTVEWENPGTDVLWTIKIQTEGTSSANGNIFRGYIIGVGETEKLSAYGNRIAVMVTLAAEAVLLSSINSSSYVYWNLETNDTAEAAFKTAPVQSDKNAMEQSALSVLRSNSDKISELTGFSDISKSATDKLQEFLIGASAYYHSHGTLGTSNVKISDYFKTDRNIQFRPEATGFSNAKEQGFSSLTETMANVFATKWAGSSVWGSLLGTARIFYISMVPRINKIELVPLMPWLKKEHLIIGADSIIGLSETTDVATLLYTPTNVRVISHLPSYTNKSNKKAPAKIIGVYPDIDESKKAQATGRIATVSMPAWAALHLERYFRNTPSKPTETGKNKYVKPRTPDQKQPEKLMNDSIQKHKKMVDSVTAFAKMAFADMHNAQQLLKLRVPWNRFGYISALGYVAKIPNLSTFANKEAQTVYGMISTVTLTVSRTATAGSAEMRVLLSHVRDEATNEELGLDEHPFYNFPYEKGLSSLGLNKGVRKSSDLNLDSRLRP